MFFFSILQKKFEQEVNRIWRRAGLRKEPEGWNIPKIYIKHGNRKQ